MTEITLHQKVLNLRSALANSMIERDAEIDAAVTAMLAQEHVLFVGPPGTGKSMLATGITDAIDGARAFQVLLTKFTTPEELFGPVKLSALREDRYERAIEGYLPSAHVGFIDEIWKASSAILNTLLTALQERRFDNGGARVLIPLRLCIAASNEWPSAEDGQELGAIFDRFLIRHVVRPVSASSRDRLLYDTLPPIEPCITLNDIDEASAEAQALPFGDDARRTMGEILDALAAEGIRPGDRRSRKSTKIARAAAWLQGASEVEPVHLESLATVLWTSPEQIEKCTDIVLRIANPVGAALTDLMHEVNEILTEAGAADAAAKTAALKKLEQCEAKAKKLVAESRSSRTEQMAKHIRDERMKLQADLLGISPDKIARLQGDAA